MLRTDFPEGLVVQRRPEGGSLSFNLQNDTGDPASPQVSSPGMASVKPGYGPGTFRIALTGLPSGGPFLLRVTCGDAVCEREFFVGDLWLMAGQSNMEGVGLMAEAQPSHPLVRNFNLARVWTQAEDPLHFLAESPDPVHHGGKPCPTDQVAAAKKAALKGAGVGIPFGRLMLEATGVPQGLISAAHGGTSMAEWSPDRAEQGTHSLYGSMLLSLRAVGQPLAGVLWYQGCSDTNDADAAAYTTRMEQLVAAVRRDLGQPELPWLTVQIGTEVGRRHLTDAWHWVQEHQRRLPERIPHLDVCTSADLEHDDWIHLSARAFPLLAQRLAAMARRLVLKSPSEPAQPQPVRVRWAPDGVSPALEVDCTGVSGALRSEGLPRGFALVDDQARERPLVYQVRFDGSLVRLRLTDDDLTGLALFHGTGAEPQVNTVDDRGCALPVFGPLAIEGLPPVSAWFRSWRVGPEGDSGQTARRRFDGWNVINLKEDWKAGPAWWVATSEAEVPEAMDLELLVGGDGPLRVWLGDKEVVTDLVGTDELARVRTSGPMRVPPGRHSVRVVMGNRGGLAWGFFLRFRRLDLTPEQTLLLPTEVVE